MSPTLLYFMQVAHFFNNKGEKEQKQKVVKMLIVEKSLHRDQLEYCRSDVLNLTRTNANPSERTNVNKHNHSGLML